MNTANFAWFLILQVFSTLENSLTGTVMNWLRSRSIFKLFFQLKIVEHLSQHFDSKFFAIPLYGINPFPQVFQTEINEKPFVLLRICIIIANFFEIEYIPYCGTIAFFLQWYFFETWIEREHFKTFTYRR